MSIRPQKPAPATPAPGKLPLTELAEMKARRQPIVMVTAYDAPGGRLADQAGADLVLVGDSAAMTVLGHESTVPATMEEMLILTRAVTRGASRPLVIADMPFGSFQVSDEDAMRNAIRFVKEAGADAVKLEGAGAMLSRVRSIVARRHPGDGAHRAHAPVGDDARRLQGAGTLGREGARAAGGRARARSRGLLLARARGGAGTGRAPDHPASSRFRPSASAPERDCDGQVLVWHDLLGLYQGRTARFVKRYADIGRDDPSGARGVRRRCPRAALPGGAAHVLDAGRRARALRAGRPRNGGARSSRIGRRSQRPERGRGSHRSERAGASSSRGRPSRRREAARATRRRRRAGDRATPPRPFPRPLRPAERVAAVDREPQRKHEEERHRKRHRREAYELTLSTEAPEAAEQAGAEEQGEAEDEVADGAVDAAGNERPHGEQQRVVLGIVEEPARPSASRAPRRPRRARRRAGSAPSAPRRHPDPPRGGRRTPAADRREPPAPAATRRDPARALPVSRPCPGTPSRRA